jgi:ribosomal protein S18 acetylase RimI-like enzyme
MMTKKTDVVIRYGVLPTDEDQIAKLVEATQFFTAAEVDVAVELIQERLCKGPASGYEFVIAESAASIVGYACFGEIPCTVGSYDLYWIVVDPSQQRSGIGQQLMIEVERRVGNLGGRGIYIDTSGREQYASTHHFYDRCGYRLVASLPDFYAPDDPKQIYWRAIP